VLAAAAREKAVLAEQLAEREAEIERLATAVASLTVELERLRGESERREDAIGPIVSAAGELS
jgi:predicted nuclease with TOPRIM domain